MANGEQQPRSTAETVRLWIQAVGIPLAIAGIGLFQFWLVQIRWPARAPVNLTTELSVKDAGSEGASISAGEDASNRLQAIELEVTARNPSARSIFLLPNVWIAYGVEVDPEQKGDWMKLMESRLNRGRQIVGGEHYAPKQPVPIAAGEIFPDTGLQPSEQIVRSFVFYVAEGAYDYVEVVVFLPTMASENEDLSVTPKIQLEWKLRPERNGYSYMLHRIRPDGTREKLPEDADIKDLGLQWSSSVRMLSLWQRR